MPYPDVPPERPTPPPALAPAADSLASPSAEVTAPIAPAPLTEAPRLSQVRPQAETMTASPLRAESPLPAPTDPPPLPVPQPLPQPAVTGTVPPAPTVSSRPQPETGRGVAHQSFSSATAELLAPASTGIHGSPLHSQSEAAEPIPAVDPAVDSELDTGPAAAAETATAVAAIAIAGSTAFPETELQSLLQGYVGRRLTPAEQQQAADTITEQYIAAGYLTSRAVLPQPAVVQGTLQIQVLEGGLERIDIVGLERLQEDYIRRRIALAADRPLNSNRLEDQLRLLRQDPRIENIEASLRAGETPTNSALLVRVEEANPITGFVGVANDSPPVVGSEQATLALAHQNLSGRGDRLEGRYQRTFNSQAISYGAGYTLPINPMQGTLRVQADFEDSRIPLAPGLDIDSQAEEYSFQYRQPLIRSPRQELALSVEFSHRDGQTFLGDRPFGFGFGPDPTTGISRTSVLRFSQDYVRRDVQGAWVMRSQFNLGTGWLGATVNPDPVPDSRFVSWLGQVQRVQQLSENHVLVVAADLQLTPNPLLPSEKFVLGGSQSVRGYRQNLVSGDNGLRVSVEDRITLRRNEAGLPTLQVAPFIDMGSVWNASGNPNPAPVRSFLAGVGAGLIWEPLPQLNLRLDYGLPLIGVPNRGNNLQDHGIYFQIGYRI